MLPSVLLIRKLQLNVLFLWHSQIEKESRRGSNPNKIIPVEQHRIILLLSDIGQGLVTRHIVLGFRQCVSTTSELCARKPLSSTTINSHLTRLRSIVNCDVCFCLPRACSVRASVSSVYDGIHSSNECVFTAAAHFYVSRKILDFFLLLFFGLFDTV